MKVHTCPTKLHHPSVANRFVTQAGVDFLIVCIDLFFPFSLEFLDFFGEATMSHNSRGYHLYRKSINVLSGDESIQPKWPYGLFSSKISFSFFQ